MTSAPSVTLAFTAGFISFLSPCCLPLVPGYLATVTAGRGPDGTPGVRRRAVWRGAQFTLSFSGIFILLGLTATALGSQLNAHQEALNRLAGATIIGLGLFFIAATALPRLNRTWQSAALFERAGRGSPVFAGAAFALAWTPCVGPTLGAILGLAATQAAVAQGGLLLAVYAGGLAIPFLMCAYAADGAMAFSGWARKHHQGIQAFGGSMLVFMGVLVSTGALFELNIRAQQLLDGLGLNIFQRI